MKRLRLNTIIRYAYLWVMIFLFTAELPLMLGLTTRRLAVVIAIFVLIAKRQQVKIIWGSINPTKISMFIVSLAFVTIISLLHTFTRTENNPYATYSEPWFFLYIVLYILVFSLFCAVEFKTLKEFVWVLIGIYLFQTVVVLRGLVDPAFRLHIYEAYNNTGDDRFIKTIEEGTRLMGINLIGAAGSVKMSTASLALVLLYTSRKIKSLWFWVSYMVIMIGTAFVGRTGILVEIALLIPLFLNGKGRAKNILYVLVFASILISAIMYVLSTLDPAVSESLLNWMTESFDSKDRGAVNEGVLQGGWPPFSLEFVFGTGMDTGYSQDGVIYTSDSGLIRTYMAYGVVGFVFYYLAMFKLLTSPRTRKCPREIRFFFGLCIAIAFIIEYKEPFMMKYIFPWAILTCILLYLKDMGNNSKVVINSVSNDKKN